MVLVDGAVIPANVAVHWTEKIPEMLEAYLPFFLHRRVEVTSKSCCRQRVLEQEAKLQDE